MYLFATIKTGVISVVLSTLLIWSIGCDAQTPVSNLTVVTVITGESRDENGELIPLRPENQKLLDNIGRIAGIRFDVRRMPIPRLLEAVKQGEGIGYGISKTSERSTYLAYSDPVFTDNVWLIVRDDAGIENSTLADLKGKSIGIVHGIRFNDEIDSQRNVLFKVEEDPSHLASRLKKLLSGRMDAMLLNSRARSAKELENELMQYMQDKNIRANTQAKPGIKVIARPFLADDVYFVTALNADKTVINRINLAMAKARKMGDMPPLAKP